MESSTDAEEAKQYISALSKYPMSLDILKQTKIGKTVNGIPKKFDILKPDVDVLVRKWKALAKQEKSEKREERKEEGESTPKGAASSGDMDKKRLNIRKVLASLFKQSSESAQLGLELE